MVLGREVRREQTQSAQVHLPGAHRLYDGGEQPSRARHHDPVVGGTLGESELADAEREHRRKREFGVQLPLVDLAEMHEELCLHATRRFDELARSGEKLRAAERPQI